jgi:hypothetical protein
MKKYTSFLKKHKAAKSEEEQKALVKDFMMSLSPDEFTAWLSESNDFIETALLELINSGDKDNIAFSKNYIKDLETILGKKALMAKAA